MGGGELRYEGAWGVNGTSPHHLQDHLSRRAADSSRASLWPVQRLKSKQLGLVFVLWWRGNARECVRGKGWGEPPLPATERALRSLEPSPTPVPENEAAWIIENGRECYGMKGSEAGRPFPITPVLLEVTKGVWV